jgi:hypothetical protein
MSRMTSATPGGLGWLQMWRIALLHPTVDAYSRISGDPKARLIWAIFFTASSSVIAWFTGPQRGLFYGVVAGYMGLEAALRFMLAGAIGAVIGGVMWLIVSAALSHAMARAMGGRGAFRQLAYCWGVIPFPFVVLAGLVMYLPALFPTSRSFVLSTPGMIVQLTTLFLFAALMLYLSYAQLIALRAVEMIGLGKGLGILLLLGIAIGLALACLSIALKDLPTHLLGLG